MKTNKTKQLRKESSNLWHDKGHPFKFDLYLYQCAPDMLSNHIRKQTF